MKLPFKLQMPLSHLIAVVVVTAVVGLILEGAGAFGIAYSGIYDISARQDHPPIVTWFLKFARDHSVRTHSSGMQVPPLDAPGMAQLGAEHYRAGCQFCHGVPGHAQGAVPQMMLPEPPDLLGIGDRYSAKDLGWAIYHGFKFTGMPGWPGDGRQDEVWPLVAYLEGLSGPEADKYIAMVANPGQGGQPQMLVPGKACSRCHGDARTPPVEAHVPYLGGQTAPYLARALSEFRDRRRQSGFMQPVAHALSDDDITRLAAHFAAEARPDAKVPGADQPNADLVARGKDIFEKGVSKAGLPACQSCHNERYPEVPRLQGQTQTYLETQLALWREGLRGQTSYGHIMAEVGTRLDPADAKAVAAYLASQPAPQPFAAQ